MLLEVQMALSQGGQLPSEYIDFTLCRAMGLTPAELATVPRYQRMCWFDFLNIERAAGRG